MMSSSSLRVKVVGSADAVVLAVAALTTASDVSCRFVGGRVATAPLLFISVTSPTAAMFFEAVAAASVTSCLYGEYLETKAVDDSSSSAAAGGVPSCCSLRETAASKRRRRSLSFIEDCVDDSEDG